MSKPIIKEKPATYADLEALPPTVVGEILYGALHTQPRPAPRHGIAAGELFSALSSPFKRGQGGPGGWIFVIEPELHVGPHVVVPDVAGWRAERLTPFPETAFITTPPDWLAEILSPSTQAIDRTDKLSIYAETGVSHCWYIDPIAKTLEVMALTGGRWLLVSALKDDAPVNAPPFEAHTFPLSVPLGALIRRNAAKPLQQPAIGPKSGADKEITMPTMSNSRRKAIQARRRKVANATKRASKVAKKAKNAG